MNRVHLLPDHVANQIAAGEVVERPASVVKELVENSLDAQATRVTIEIQAGGRSLIRVTDDGLGMSRDDALLCLERHATSKIQKAEDLAAIATMGFRGEALPSIASISRFTLTTRERETFGVPPSGGPGSRVNAELQTVEGTQIVINGGKILEVKAAGSAPGTTIEVRQIFFNLPARRKFLRTEETEAAHIQHYLTLAALAFPEVAFTFQKDGRIVWQLPGVKSGAEISARLPALRERLRSLYGDEQKLLSVDFSKEITEPNEVEDTPDTSHLTPRTSHFRVWGFIGAPGVSRSTREDQHLFVNRRPVENRGLNFALMEGYHTALMKGRYPVCCLFLEIDPAAVDVNIHPAKREVKFHRERDVRQLVAQAVRETLLAFHRGDEKSKPVFNAETQRPPSPQRKTVDAIGQTFDVAPTPEFSTPSLPQFPLPPKPAPEWPARQIEQPPLKMGFASPITPTPRPNLTPDTSHLTHSPIPLLNVPMRLVGVIGRLYVVLESDRGLVLLDQHAAHERILFEQMLNRIELNQQAPSQKLLLPETVELSARDATFLRGQLSELTRLGVGLSEFGERTFLLDALPPFVKVSDARRFVLELVDELKAAGQDVNSARLGEHVVAKTVCRHAVKANDPLAGPELENLVNDLRHCAMPYTCPHGRPTLIEMNFRELEKKFGRTQ
ncbi:MAG: mismatch repair protein MutL [Verrucomicrobiota bacterium]|jgi:DNA mismatch repair protein MutL